MTASKRETHLAIRNGVKLLLSLFGTLLVAFAVRFWLPRHLGPLDYGRIHFGESFAILLIGLTTLGIDSYIGKEVATRREHANEFFAGILLVRLTASALVCVVGALALAHMGKPSGDWRLVYLFFAWHALFVLNNSLAALLKAQGEVGALSTLRVLSKIVWGGGIAAALLVGAPLEAVPVAFIVAEAMTCTGLAYLTRRHLGLRLRWDWAAVVAVLAASFPFFVNNLAHRVYNRVDVYMLAEMIGDQEVGWYGAAANIAALTTLLIPVIDSVVLPMAARIAANESKEAMGATLSGIARLSVVFSVAVCIELTLHARSLILLLFGAAYEPAIPSLQVLAFTFPLTYFCVLVALRLIALGRVWAVARVSLMGLIINPTLNYLFLREGHAWLGDGGGGAVAAATTVTTEIIVAVGLATVSPQGIVDRRLLRTVGLTTMLAVLVVGVHTWLPLPGLWKIPFEVLVYVAVGSLLGVVPLARMVNTARAAFGRQRDDG